MHEGFSLSWEKMELKTVGIVMVYMEDAGTKSFKMPKWSVLLALSLKFKILTSGCYAVSVR